MLWRVTIKCTNQDLCPLRFSLSFSLGLGAILFYIPILLLWQVCSPILCSFLNSPTLSVPLKLDFYQKSCPSAEAMVKSTVTKAFVNSGIAAAFHIRLRFHDCFVRVITLFTLIFLISQRIYCSLKLYRNPIALKINPSLGLSSLKVLKSIFNQIMFLVVHIYLFL